jgi:hypothetical protein
MNLPIRIVYPVPMDTPDVWNSFELFIRRFADTLRWSDPGCEYELVPVVNSPPPNERRDWTLEVPLKALFHGIPFREIPLYHGKGSVVGSFQHYADLCEPCFMACCTTRTYAWRPGWLKRLADARGMYGPGLYTTSICKETGRLFASVRCVGMDSEDLKRYPTKVVTLRGNEPGACDWFENGDGCVFEWYQKQGLPTKVVYWDGAWDIVPDKTAHCCAAPNIWRRGDQSNMLVLDKHTDLYRDVDEATKKMFEERTYNLFS